MIIIRETKFVSITLGGRFEGGVEGMKGRYTRK